MMNRREFDEGIGRRAGAEYADPGNSSDGLRLGGERRNEVAEGESASDETQVTQSIAAVLPAADGALASEAQLDASVVECVVAGTGKRRSDPPSELDEAVGAMVLLLEREAVARVAAGR